MSKRLKNIVALICLFALAISLVACTDKEPQDTQQQTKYFTVRFNTYGGTPIPDMSVPEGGLVEQPENPKLDNAIFRRWTCNGLLWDFHHKRVTEDITFDAVWIPADSTFSLTSVNGFEGLAISGMLREDYIERLEVPTIINGKTVIGIADGGLANCYQEQAYHIVFPNSVTYVGKEAFYGIDDVDLTFEGKITYLGESAFESCTTITTVPLGDGLTEIPYRAFYGCTGLSTVTLPSGVSTIKENAFSNCTSLLTVILPKSLTTVENSAFEDCTSLKTVFFMGTAAEFDAITVAQGNSAFETARVCFYSEEKPSSDGSYWHYDKNGKPIIW